MDRDVVRKGIVALLLAAALGLVGARPAAAEETGRAGGLRWLAGFWGEIVELSGLGEGMDSIFSFWSAASTQSETDKGFGVDPNGNSITLGPLGPSAPGGGTNG